MRALIALAVALALLAAMPAAADSNGVKTYEAQGSFDDATFNLEGAIVGRGFVVDHVSHVGEMLSRTAADVGATRQVYDRADVYLFCSATLSRRMMEADPDNIAHCPYSVFVYQLAGEPDRVAVGYRRMPDGPMQEVEAMLDEIAREAADLD